MSGHMLHCSEQQSRRIPWYFITIISFFILPITALFKYVKNIEYTAFAKTIGIVMILGYSWSYLVTSHSWWVFNPETMLGVEIFPHLPLEEVLFYPLGGALSILVYLAIVQNFQFTAKAGKVYVWVLAGLTAICIGAVVVSEIIYSKLPAYFLSQIILYNSLGIGLWFLRKHRLVWKAAWLTVFFMSIIGFFWNWIAFTQKWWTYYAVLGWEWPPHVPIDDWNFFIFAPLAAISVYECFRKRMI